MQLAIRQHLALLVTYLKPVRSKASLMALCLVLGTGLQLLSPQILRYFIDTATRQGPSPSLVFSGLLFIFVTLVNQGITVATTYLSGYVAWTATNQMRLDLITHCLKLDMRFHQEHTPGEMIERIDGDVDALSNFFSQFVVHLLNNALLIIGGLLILFTIHWLIGLAMTIFTAMALIVMELLRRRSVPLWTERRQVSATFFGFIGERLAGTEDIRANDATSYMLWRFLVHLRQFATSWRKSGMAAHVLGIATTLLFVIGNILALTLGVFLWTRGNITLGTIYAIYAYADLLSQPIQQLQEQMQDWQQAEACIKRVTELLSTPSNLVDGTTATLPEEAQSLAIDNLSFGYTKDKVVLQDLTLHVQAGKTLGIVGRTGSGKTTLARLLFRLYDPQQGEIRLGQTAIKNVPMRALRQHIGMVTQDVQLFHATVRDNLTFFNQTIADTTILAALADLGLLPWYQTLPAGLDTMLGSDNGGLSAGQAQLLAFVRVLLKNPGLVILDEASARLDPATERMIEHAIARLLQGRTAIVIAHRLATIQKVDEILVLEDGRILEHGSRNILANDPSSRFALLLQASQEGALV